MTNPTLRKATAGTLRQLLFKVGALICESTRRFWIHLSSGWPHRPLLQQAIADI
ncbi:MAG: transposase, partial [Armatimonadota bacterium]